MGNKQQRTNYSSSFETKLIAYQKFAVFLMVPPLISTFWCIMPLMGIEFGDILVLAAARLIQAYAPFSFAGAIYSVLLLGFTVVLSLRAARGTFAFYIAGFALYAADLIVDVVLCFLPSIGKMSVLSLVVHGVLLAAFAFGIVMYKSAEKKLREDQKGHK